MHSSALSTEEITEKAGKKALCEDSEVFAGRTYVVWILLATAFTAGMALPAKPHSIPLMPSGAPVGKPSSIAQERRACKSALSKEKNVRVSPGQCVSQLPLLGGG